MYLRLFQTSNDTKTAIIQLTEDWKKNLIDDDTYFMLMKMLLNETPSSN
jgi:hypothetical protein